MVDISRIALALQGMGEGMAGRGAQWRQERRELSLERKQAMAQDALAVRDLLRTGNTAQAMGLLAERRDLINQMGGDPSDTMRIAESIMTGNKDAALAELDGVVSVAQARGLLAAPQVKRQVVGNQIVEIGPDGRAVASDIEGLRLPQDKPKQQIIDGQLVTIEDGTASASPIAGLQKDPGDAKDRALRARELAIKESTEKRQSTKLSAGLEKALIDSQDRVVQAQRNANNYSVLANDFERLQIEGGLKTTFSETLKGILGTQDDVTEFRRNFNKVRLSEGLKNLPPGPATDKDVQEAFKGVPPENAPYKQVASFLRGAAKLAQFEAGYNQFKADFISKESSAKGLNRRWRERFDSKRLGRKVSMAEIYQTAQSRQMPPEEVAAQIGVDL